MDNTEVARRLDEIIHQLEGLEERLLWLCDSEMARRQHEEARWQAIGPRAVGGWPNPATAAQGFLSGRFQRRDGTGFPSATAADAKVNSPIRGGDDANARVDVPSGEPRS